MPGKEHLSAKLSPHQDRAIFGLLREDTIQGAADYAGVNERTLRRWMAEDEGFIEAYREARRRVLDHAVGQLQRDASYARKVLRRNMDCGNPHAEIRAARSVLDYAIRGEELFEVVALLEEAERMDRDGE